LSLVFLAGFVIVASASAAIISEVRLGPPDTADNYLELTLTPGDAPFDLVVMDANPNRYRWNTVKAVFTITPQSASTQVVLLHEGVWPAPLPAGTQSVSVASLWLIVASANVSRHLVVMPGITHWSTTDSAATLPSPAQWAADDIWTYCTSADWPVASALAEPVWLLSPGDAVWRHVDPVTGDFTRDFSTGPVDDQDVFLNDPHAALDPGLVNIPYTTLTATDDPPPAAHYPEPAAGTLLAVSATLLLAACRRTPAPSPSSLIPTPSPHPSNAISPPTCSRIA